MKKLLNFIKIIKIFFYNLSIVGLLYNLSIGVS